MANIADSDQAAPQEQSDQSLHCFLGRFVQIFKVFTFSFFPQLFHDIVPNIPIGDCASGHRDENRNKSRDIMLLPRK